MNKTLAMELINKNIEEYGFHLYLVDGSTTPRYIYTVGLSNTTGFEIAMAGGLWYSDSEASSIVNLIAKDSLRVRTNVLSHYDVGDLGSFNFREIDRSWIKNLLLAIPDYFRDQTPQCYQIVPDANHTTIDVPAMDHSMSYKSEPIWRWLTDSWDFVVKPTSKAVTDIAALKGEQVMEAMRWEEFEWELFAGRGDQIQRHHTRKVPLSVLLGADASLAEVTRLGVGKGIWRNPVELTWNEWDSSQ